MFLECHKLLLFPSLYLLHNVSIIYHDNFQIFKFSHLLQIETPSLDVGQLCFQSITITSLFSLKMFKPKDCVTSPKGHCQQYQIFFKMSILHYFLSYCHSLLFVFHYLVYIIWSRSTLNNTGEMTPSQLRCNLTHLVCHCRPTLPQ